MEKQFIRFKLPNGDSYYLPLLEKGEESSTELEQQKQFISTLAKKINGEKPNTPTD